ncbi:MAG: isocitrate/isopropylmalate dehydrogenase family protein [Candidatus Njordarchaeia archaeon]
MVSYRVTLIPGDGTGPELIEASKKVIEAALDVFNVKIEWDIHEAGIPAYEKYGDPLPKETLDSIRRNKVAWKGPITTPVGTGYRSVNVAIRKTFDLYAIVRPVSSFEGLSFKYPNVDLVFIREGTEEFYSGIEHRIDTIGDKRIAAESIGVVTRKACEKISRFAFEYARRYKRKKVTAVHKANILKETHGLFKDVFFEIAKEYPDIESEDRIVDNMAFQLVVKPHEYDVIVTTNLMGDILSDLGAGLVGGLGVAPSGNIGDEYAVFEATHGSAPKYAGKNKVNPTATLLAGVMMLRHLNLDNVADLVEKAAREVIKEGKYVTYDICRITGCTPVGTSEMADAMVRKIKELS